MAQLKPLPKAILIAAVIAGVGFGVYKTGIVDKLGKKDATATSYSAAPTDSGTPVAATTPGSTTPTNSTPPQPPAVSSASDLTVSLVSFHGYAPALVANGNSLTTQSGSIYDKLGLKLKIVIQDDVPTLATIFEAKTAQCAWRTSDFWAQEQPNLRNAKLDGRAVMVVDNTQGGDAIIAKDQSIRSVEDLVGKSVALLQFTPSHGLLIDAIENSSLSGKKKASIKTVFINADEGTGGVRAAFESGKVDAAVIWDPDLSLALKNGGGHVVYSTKSATNLIYDVMVCDTRVLNTPAGRESIKKFVKGWMDGVVAARQNPDNAVQALIKTEPMFEQLAQKQGAPFIKSLFSNLVWTGVEDNARIFGMVGGTNHYERVYKYFDPIYRAAGALANPASPVINPADSVDYSFIKELVDANQAQVAAAAAKIEPTFTDTGRSQTKAASVTKPVLINFESGSAELTQKAKKTIDTEMVPFLENNGSAYVELNGNTDSTGSAAVNKPLSTRRAQAVAAYLTSQWEVPAARLKTIGNGSDKPICQEPGTADGLSLDECRALNRTTRVGILK